jgi:hypothetical protein
VVGRETRAEFNDLGKELVAALREDAPKASRAFERSIKKKVSGRGFDTELSVFSEAAHAEAIEEGRKPGKQPRVNPIYKWLRRKGIGARAFSVRTRRTIAAGTPRSRERRTGKLRNRARSLAALQRGIAFAISKAIGADGLPRKTGFPPSHRLFLFRDLEQRESVLIDRSTRRLEDRIAQALNG